jgi:DedD protein
MVTAEVGSTMKHLIKDPLSYTRAMQTLSDRALKERIIGAVVLVLAAVLVVPIFLDGSANDEEIVRTSVTLPGQNHQSTQRQTIVLNRDRSEPVPTAATVVAPPAKRPTNSTPESTQPEPVADMPVDPPSEEKKPTVTTSASSQSAPDTAAETSSTGMWALQLGSFSNEESADKLATDLRDQGYAAFLSQLNRNGSALHRVRIGPQKDRDSADAIAAQLLKSGHIGQVVPHP